MLKKGLLRGEQVRLGAIFDEINRISLPKEQERIRKHLEINPKILENCRYSDTVCFEENSVNKVSEVLPSTLINGSQIRGFKTGNRFLALENPKPSAQNDFFQTLLNHKSEILINLTNAADVGPQKFGGTLPYWQLNRPVELENGVQVDMQCENDLPDENGMIRRKFTYRRKNGEKIGEITQFHYVGWPDHGNADVNQIKTLIQEVRSQCQENQPIAVHCDAGCGRTGTFIGIFDSMTRIEAGETRADLIADLPEQLQHLREQRAQLIQTKEQFQMLYNYINL